jgi:hypothetical protein
MQQAVKFKPETCPKSRINQLFASEKVIANNPKIKNLPNCAKNTREFQD